MKFEASEFTPTKVNTAEDKAKFANQFMRFVESDFKQSLFTKAFYQRLSLTFGHIAHFNQGGFFEQFFTTTADVLRFLEQSVNCPCYGDPEWTYSDVERALVEWLKGSGLIEKYRLQLSAEVEDGERALLEVLQRQFGAV